MSNLIRADLHMHTYFSKDSGASPKSIVDRCVKMGINCIAITDHDNIEGAIEVKDMAPFDVIIGEEVSSLSGDIIGLFLNDLIPGNLTPLETAQAIKSQGGLVMVPHPFDRIRPSAITMEAFNEILPYIDIIETFNARNIFGKDDDKAIEMAKEHHIIFAVSSDAHTAAELGRTYNSMERFDGTPAGFKVSLANAELITKRANFFLRFAPSYARLRGKLRL